LTQQHYAVKSSMSSVRSNKVVFFFLSAGWGPVVRTLPIANRLVDHGITSSFAIGGAIGPKIRAAGFDLIELDLPEFNAPSDEAAGWWSPYHFLALHDLENLAALLDHVEAYRRAISAGRPAVVVTDINPVAALAARSLQIPHITISQSIFLPFRKFASITWWKEVPEGMPSALPAINKVLAHYGVDGVESAEYLDVGDVTFVPSIPEFDPMQGAPPSLHYVHDVRRAIENVITKPAYARECAKWSQTISARRYGGADLIARIIMRMI